MHTSMFTSYREFVRKFPKEPEGMDNRWLEQAVFNNSNKIAPKHTELQYPNHTPIIPHNKITT